MNGRRRRPSRAARYRRPSMPAPPAYDGLVGANPGYHAHLRISAWRLRHRGRWSRVAAARRAARHRCLHGRPAGRRSAARIVAVDASAGMLAMAAGKPWPDSVRFVHSRIEDLADAGFVGPFDGILAAYLIRNLADPDETLRRFGRLLRPGARLAVHEYSVRDSRRATATWNAVCAAVIIPAGRRLRSGEATLYRYLRRSVNAFDGASAIRELFAPQRFHRCAQPDGAGAGSATSCTPSPRRRHDDRSTARRASRTARCPQCGHERVGARTLVVVVAAVDVVEKDHSWVAASAAGARLCPTVPRWR